MTDLPMKRCSKCKHEFPRTPESFSRRKGTKDGLRSACKNCTRPANARWNRENPERTRGADSRYRANSPQKAREKLARWRARNPDRVRELSARYYAENAEERREKSLRWRKKNPDQVRAQSRCRRARKRNAIGTHTANDVQQQYKRQKGRCYYCNILLGDTYHVDHVVPLSRGGSNDPQNLVIACRNCNERKHNKLPHEWPEGGRLL